MEDQMHIFTLSTVALSRHKHSAPWPVCFSPRKRVHGTHWQVLE